MLSFTKYDKDNVEFIKEIGAYSYYVAISIILYAVVLYFIYKFYSMFKKIAVDDNTEKLMSTILKTRKVVKQYIAFNLSAFAFIFIAAGSYGFYKGYSTGIATNGELTKIPLEVTIIGIIILIVVTAILTCVFWLIYKLIYGWLLKRLYVNYQELKKIDF
jgi:Na+/H+ antiporter NhaC